jgi:hypothetical protein
MRHFKHQILFIVIVLYSCGQVNQNRNIQSLSVDKSHSDTLFIKFDNLESKWNSTPVNFDTLYRLAKQLNIQADNYQNRKEIKLTTDKSINSKFIYYRHFQTLFICRPDWDNTLESNNDLGGLS